MPKLIEVLKAADEGYGGDLSLHYIEDHPDWNEGIAPHDPRHRNCGDGLAHFIVAEIIETWTGDVNESVGVMDRAIADLGSVINALAS